MTVAMNPFAVFQKELTICGSFINPNTHIRAIELIRQGVIDIEPLITHRISLDEVPHIANTSEAVVSSFGS